MTTMSSEETKYLQWVDSHIFTDTPFRHGAERRIGKMLRMSGLGVRVISGL